MKEITCPSGLKGTIRKMKTKDERLLADRKIAKEGKSITALLNACWIETVDQGPYLFNKLNWSDVALQDRMYALLQIRIYSVGSTYEFRQQCTSCGDRFPWRIDLNGLDVKEMSAEAKAYFSDQVPLEVKLADGSTVYCRPLVGKDEEFFARLNVEEQNRILTYHLARKIVRFNDETDGPDIFNLVEDLDIEDADFIWNVTDDYEGGVDTQFNIECDQCGTIRKVALPFEASFFSRRKRLAS